MSEQACICGQAKSTRQRHFCSLGQGRGCKLAALLAAAVTTRQIQAPDLHKTDIHKPAALQAAEGAGRPSTSTGAAPLPAAFAAAGRLVSAHMSHAAPCAAAALGVLQHSTTGKSVALLSHHCVVGISLMTWLCLSRTLPCHAT